VEENLFPNSTGTENVAEADDYQLVFVLNAHTEITLEAPVVWLSNETDDGATLSFAADNTPPRPLGSTEAQADSIPNKDTAPAGITSWVTPSTAATGLTLGDLPPGYVKGIWIRRHATNSSLLTEDGGVLAVTGSTQF
jgi:hypothetical protein